MNCLYCGGPIPRHRPNKKFCSHACRQAAYVNRNKIDELGDLYSIDLGKGSNRSYNPNTLIEVLTLSGKLDLHFSVQNGNVEEKLVLLRLKDFFYRLLFWSYLGKNSRNKMTTQLKELQNDLSGFNFIFSRYINKMLTNIEGYFATSDEINFDQSTRVFFTALLVSIRKGLDSDFAENSKTYEQ